MVTGIKALIEPIMANHSVGLVDVVLRGVQNNQVLEIFIDSEKGVTADICADVSKDISEVLERIELVRGQYRLIVSSPGVNRPLQSLKQYKKYLGRKLRVTFRNQMGNKTIEGTLVNCTEYNIELHTEKEPLLTLTLDTIVDAKVSLPW